jgi:hypothetical protein
MPTIEEHYTQISEEAKTERQRPKQAQLINPSTGQHHCPHCGQTWYANIKPQSNGRYYRGGKQCPNGCTSRKAK